MKADYSDLKNKTVFDFCEDESILKEITGFSSKKEYFKLVKNMSVEINAIHLSSLADITGDSLLKGHVDKQFKKVLDLFFNE